ncbi:PHO85 cyclin-5, partial [Linderina macrospora]
MFYLLRAKSIIQARQRAAKQKEEAEEEQRKQQVEQIEKQNQMSFQSILDAATQNTPPLSPSSPMSMSRASTNSSAIVKSSSSSAHTANSILSPPSSSPITPGSTQQAIAQAPFVTMDKQLLDNGIISPTQVVTPEKKQQMQARALAGNTKALPMSFREFMSKDAPLMAVNCSLTTSGNTTTTTTTSAAGSTQETGGKPKKPDVTKCGRRMFVAALVSASKFMYDRTYSNRAWNKITKLPLAQISDMERAFLDMIDYRLYVDQRTYDKFHRLLARSGMRNGRLMVCEPASASDAAGPRLQINTTTSSLSPQQQQSLQQTTASQMSPTSPTEFTFVAPSAAPSPEQQRAKVQKMMIQYSLAGSPNTPVTGDLRSAMNVPVSV